MYLLILLIAIIVGYFILREVQKEERRKELEAELLAIAEKNKHIVPEYDEDILEAKLTEDYLGLDNYIGQKLGIQYLKGHINKSKRIGKPLPHIILWGTGGLGKSTLVKAVAQCMGGRFIELIPANLKNTKELFNRFFKKTCPHCSFNNPFSTNRCLACKKDVSIYFTPQMQLKKGDIIFLEECHSLKDDIEEAMYSLMQDSYMQLRFNGMDQRVDFPDITIAGATTRLGDLSKPFRDRFKINVKLEPYGTDDIKEIIRMYGEHKGLKFNPEALDVLSQISHGIPRTAKKYVDDVSTLSDDITKDNLKEIMGLLRIDNKGLDVDHHKIMDYILLRMKSVKNGGAGSAAISSAIAIPKAVYEEVYEPPLLYQGLIYQGSKGRRLTDKAIKLYYPTEKANIK